MHLPKCIDIKVHMQQLIKKLNLENEIKEEDIPTFLKSNKFFIILDSFDEMQSKENVIDKIFMDLGTDEGNKILITCRSDYYLSKFNKSEIKKIFAPKREESKLD